MRKNSCHLMIIQLTVIIFALFFSLSVECRLTSKVFDDLSLDSSNNSDVFLNGGEKWAILIAGSSGYENYRHQADVCHAYQVMKKGGLKDENIIVFMYDDIAFNVDNPNQGMPQNEPAIYAKDFIEVLKKKHASNTYKSMLVNLEVFFDGLLPNNLSIYATTASNPDESSYATYCDGDPGVPSEYNNTCLGDLYSISWMEDSERKDPRNETLRQQFAVVKNRTSEMSHVSEYGDVHLSSNYLSLYIALESRKPNQTYSMTNQSEPITPLYVVEQREADLIYFKEMVRRAPEGSKQKIEAQKRLDDVISQRNMWIKPCKQLQNNYLVNRAVLHILQRIDQQEPLLLMIGIASKQCNENLLARTEEFKVYRGKHYESDADDSPAKNVVVKKWVIRTMNTRITRCFVFVLIIANVYSTVDGILDATVTFIKGNIIPAVIKGVDFVSLIVIRSDRDIGEDV
uniref:Uncharacterized protein n=1 Tax=Chenopodium quinoa TaxID=63459 RepID=A0A803NAK2_CHEQI